MRRAQLWKAGGGLASGWLLALVLLGGCARFDSRTAAPIAPPPMSASPPPPVIAALPAMGSPPVANGGDSGGGPIAVRPRRPARATVAPAARSASSSEQCRGLGIVDPARCIDHDRLVSDLKDGLSAFKVPRRMVKDESYIAALAITRSSGGPAALATALANAPGQLSQSETKVARDMSARLTGVGFTIAPAGLVRMRLNSAEPTSWEWSVVPTTSGRRELKLETFVHLILPDGEEMEALPVKRELIDISVAPRPPPTRGERVSLVTRGINGLKDLVDSIAGLIAAVVALAAALGWRLSKGAGKASGATTGAT